MYSRSNAYASSPGVWFTDDGEFELYRGHKPGYATDVWYVKTRAYWTEATGHTSREIGDAPTLKAAFALAARYYVHPVVPVDNWVYPDTLAPMTTPDYAPELGKRFVTIVEEWLTPEEFEEVRTRNDTRTPGVCHSHDFCDANMAMDQAWLDVLNRHPSILPDPSEATDAEYAEAQTREAADADLWSRAWDWAIEHYLSHSPVAVALEEDGFPPARS
jgi:hypothetical protein